MISGLFEAVSRLVTRKAIYATSTPPKLKSYAPAADFGYTQDAKPPKKVRADFLPVYVAKGTITLSTTLGLHTALQQLKNSPQVRETKKLRETLPEVEEPDRVLDEADRFTKQSFFRIIAHVQENNDDYAIHDTTRGDIFAHRPMPRPETLKPIGDNPTFRVLDDSNDFGSIFTLLSHLFFFSRKDTDCKMTGEGLFPQLAVRHGFHVYSERYIYSSSGLTFSF
ncbi:uncharacterized protein LOC111303886 [Durio zibethinus]|uniref:Uncharacterized protein LOC111303886 n=1 Tax=Durio zibethinus TaxID=66656 RepID=A0A6P5ZUC9_DURZI|nr:uncharacterized protein LOC111303886 [Durio zibethinus]